MKRKKVIVIGGGFAGVQFIKSLDSNYFDILLIDKINHHQFQPLFYQVATSQIEPSSISFPLRHVFRNKKNIQFRLAEVQEIQEHENIVTTDIGDFSYNYLIIAIGCKTNFFGNKNIENNTFTLKTTYDAITIRNHILQTFEDIISATAQEKEALLNLVIVGAGPTGVELAGAFAEIKQKVLPKDYKGIDFSKFKIHLIEGSQNTLNNMSDLARKTSRKYLENMGIEVVTNTFVKDYDSNMLTLNTGKTIKVKTVIWAAGVTGNTIQGLEKFDIKPNGRITVNRINQVVNSSNIFALGDIAYMETPNHSIGHPQVANVAINQAKNLAKNLKKIQLGKSTKEYTYQDLGSMATVGRNKAVVDLPFMKFKGFSAWIVWMFLHLMLILTVRNKLIIFINWAWTYITQDTSLSLMLIPRSKSKK